MIRPLAETVFLGVALVAAIFGCRSFTPPVTYYTLSPIAPPSSQTAGEVKPGLIIGIPQVDLPGLVNRTQIVTRDGPNELKISSFHRWADYPDRLVQQTLGENLQMLMPEAGVVNAPWPIGLNPDVTVAFKFMELIGTSDGEVLLSAVWTIKTNDPASAVQSHRLTLNEPISGDGFDQLAAAHSRALATLARMVADSLSGFRR